MKPILVVRHRGLQDYDRIWQEMRTFTDARVADTLDELWWVEHPPVYTLGQAGKEEHILTSGDIPVVKSDRGGQVTYHGPGQLVGYLLFDIRRLGYGVRDLVTGIEQSVISLLAQYGVASEARRDAPGVYVDGRKVAALGLRIRKGCSYHGLSLNIDMDLAPFGGINPCGYEGLEVTDLHRLGVIEPMDAVCSSLTEIVAREFGYNPQP